MTFCKARVSGGLSWIYDSCQNLIPITMPLYYLNNASSTGALLSQFSTPAMQSMDFGDYKFNVFVPATNNPCVGSCCTESCCGRRCDGYIFSCIFQKGLGGRFSRKDLIWSFS